jgi:hypothetical protein
LLKIPVEIQQLLLEIEPGAVAAHTLVHMH